jgi:hypothetical protein
MLNLLSGYVPIFLGPVRCQEQRRNALPVRTCCQEQQCNDSLLVTSPLDGATRWCSELNRNVGDGVDQATLCVGVVVISAPSLNLTPAITFGN